ncbi:hypothetical protein Micbo1qcDRAFT_22257 [Microdochium bolleyi]|uniref:RBR-type E3 ubiquitin transferase n=1 Tax=Microdochium bolleyi TaxID=196109 RepID=A0A136IRD9_9PEZI|nr:hypothetical protein Micbo1qcDRAFT_22257 [Microdochium bolleyi]
MWKVLSSFPLPRHLGCSDHHEVNFCSGCLATHMETRIEELGSARCHLLSCMMPDCERRLTYEEVKFFASKATFEKYDRYLLLNRISSDPNFRWCLREGCRSGQIVPDAAVHNLPEGYYNCDGCGFEMCSSHQTAWHTGMTCAQVNTRQAQEEASERQQRDGSRQWIEQNTKTCPGCNVRIEKNAGCFHMTCKLACSFRPACCSHCSTEQTSLAFPNPLPTSALPPFYGLRVPDCPKDPSPLLISLHDA